MQPFLWSLFYAAFFMQPFLCSLFYAASFMEPFCQSIRLLLAKKERAKERKKGRKPIKRETLKFPPKFNAAYYYPPRLQATASLTRNVSSGNYGGLNSDKDPLYPRIRQVLQPIHRQRKSGIHR